MDRKKLAEAWGLGNPYQQSVKNYTLRELDGMNKPQQQYIGDKESKETYLGKEDKDYGVLDWAKDAFSEFFLSMNKAQADDFAGQYQRADEKINAADKAIEEIQNGEKFDVIRSYFNDKREGKNTLRDLTNVIRLYPQLNGKSQSEVEKFIASELNKLVSSQKKDNYNFLLKDMNSSGLGWIASLKHKLGIAIHDNKDNEHGSIAGFTQDWIGDRVTDASGLLYGIDGATNSEKVKMLQNYKKQLKAVQDYSKVAQHDNEQEGAWYDKAHHVSNTFKAHAAKGQRDLQNGGSMWTWDNLLYSNIQQQGFSSSSWDKLGFSMAASIAAGVLTGGGSTAMQLAGAGLATTGAIASYQAGISENNAEVIENLKQRVKNNLQKKGLYDKVMKTAKTKLPGKTEEDILDAIAHGDYAPQSSAALKPISQSIAEALSDAKSGANALFDRDMYAVAADSAFNAILYAGSGFKTLGSAICKSINSAAKYLPFKQSGKWLLTRAGNVGSKITAGTGRAFELGQATGTGLVGGFAGAGSKMAYNVAKEGAKLTPEGSLLRNAYQWAAKQYEAGEGLVKKVLTKTHKDDLVKDVVLQRRLSKYVKTPAKLMGKIAASGYSESIEEGKQYLNAQDWIKNEDPQKVVTFFDGIMKDASYGKNLISAAMGIPFGQQWGIAAKDGELYSNMAGGWLGGAMHTAIVSGATDGISMLTTPGRVSITKMLAENAELGKAITLSRFTKGAEIAALASNKAASINRELDQFEKINKQRKDLGLSHVEDDDIKAEHDYVKLIVKNSNNAIIRQALDNAGIQEGTQDWNDTISAYTLYSQMEKENEDVENQTNKEIQTSSQQLAHDVLEEDIAENIYTAENDPLLKAFEHKAAITSPEEINARAKAFAKQVKALKKLAEKIATLKQDIDNGNEDKKDEYNSLKAQYDSIQDQIEEQIENNSVAAQPKEQTTEKLNDTEEKEEAPINLGSNGLRYATLANLVAAATGIKEIIDNVDVADKYSEKRSHHDTEYVKQQLQKELDGIVSQLEKIGTKKSVEKVLANPEQYILDKEQFDNLKDLHQKRVSYALDKNIASAFRGLILGTPQFAKDSEGKMFLKAFSLSKAHDVIGKLRDSVNSQYKLLDEVNQEYERSQRASELIAQTAQEQGEEVSSVVIDTIAQAMQKLNLIIEESDLVEFQLDANTLLDKELDQIGAALMNGAFMSGNYSWEDAVKFVAKQMQLYNISNDKIMEMSSFFKQWYMAQSVLGIYDSVAERFDDRRTVIQNPADDIIYSMLFDKNKWLNVKKAQLGVNTIFESLYDFVGIVLQINNFKVGDKFGIAFDSDVVLYTVSKVDENGFALDIYDEFSNPLMLDGRFLSPEDHELLKYNPSQVLIDTVNKINNTLNRVASQSKKSGRNYFVKEADGKNHLYRNSSSLTTDQYEDEPSRLEARQNVAKLILNLLRNKQYDAIKSVRVLFDVRHNKYASETEYRVNRDGSYITNLQDYIDYLNQWDDPSDDILQDTAEALADIMVQQESNPALELAYITRAIIRDVFSLTLPTVEQFPYDDYAVEVEDRYYKVSQIFTKKAFTELVNDLIVTKRKYENDLHYHIMPSLDNIFSTVTDRNGKKVRVAGKSELVAVDEDGNVHIIDTPTSRYIFEETLNHKPGPFYDKTRKLFDKYNPNQSSYEQVSERLSTFAKMLQTEVEDINLSQHPIEIMPVHMLYDYRTLDSSLRGGTQPGVTQVESGRNSNPWRIVLTYTDDILGGTWTILDDQQQVEQKKTAVIDKLNDLLDQYKQLSNSIDQFLLSAKYDQDSVLKLRTLKRKLQRHISRLEDIINKAQNITSISEIDDAISTILKVDTALNNVTTESDTLKGNAKLEIDPGESFNEEQNDRKAIKDFSDQLKSQYEAWLQMDSSDPRYRVEGSKILTNANRLMSMVLEYDTKHAHTEPILECEYAKNLILNIKNQNDTSNIVSVRTRTKDGSNWVYYNTVEKYYQEKSVGSKGTRFSDVCGNSDFSEKSETVVVGKPFQARYGTPGMMIPVIIRYNGEIFGTNSSPLYIRIARNQSGNAFVSKIVQAYSQKTDNQEVILTGMDRTMGYPHEAENPEAGNVLDSAVIPQGTDILDVKMYDTISNGQQRTRFYLSKHRVASDRSTPVILTDGSGHQVYEFQNVVDPISGSLRSGGTPGVVYAVVTPDYRNKTMSPEPMIVPINNTNITDSEVDFLLDLLNKKLDDPFEIETNDGFYLTSATNKDVINMFINYGTWQRTHPATSISAAVLEGGLLVTITYGGNNQQQMVTRVFNMSSDSDQNGKPALREFLKKLRVEVNKGRIESSTKNGSLFRAVRTYFRDNPSETKLVIPGTRLIFDKADFTGNKSISGLAWMMKTGMLQSKVDKFINPRISYNDCEIKSDQQEEQPVAPEQPVIDNDEPSNFIYDDEDEYNYDDSMNIATGNQEKVQKEAVERHLKQIFGPNVSLEVVDNYANIIENFPPGLAGRCFRDMIYVSTHATRGTEYHEAFHRVYRLLINKKEREKLNKAIRKVYAKVNGQRAAENATEKDLNEFAADRCQRYFLMHNNEQLTLKNFFTHIYEHYKAYKKIGSLRLYWTYMKMHNGRYSNNQILEENKDVLMNVKDDKFAPHGRELKHVYGSNQYNTLIRSLYYYVALAYGLKSDFSNVSKIKLEREDLEKELEVTWPARWKNIEQIRKALARWKELGVKKYPHNLRVNEEAIEYDETKKKFVKVKPKVRKISIKNLILESARDGETRAAINDILDNWDVCKYDLIKYMDDLGIDYTVDNDHSYEKVMLAGDLGFEDQELGWLDTLLKDSFETPHVTRAARQIKRLFSTFKAYKPDEKGIWRPVRNECGLFEYMDHKAVFNMVILDCLGIKTPKEMMDLFYKKFKSGDEIYRQIYEVINPYYRHQTKSNKKTGKLELNANNEQIITLLFNLICATQNNFKTILANRSGGKYIHTVIDCGQDYEAKAFREQWGKMLFHGTSKYFGRDADKNLTITDDGVKLIFNIYRLLQNIKNRFKLENIDAVNQGFENIPEVTVSLPELGIKEHTIKLDDYKKLDIIKRDIVFMLNALGIKFSYDEFNFMLKEMVKQDPNVTDNQDSPLVQLAYFLNHPRNISKLWEGKESPRLVTRDDKDNIVSNVKEGKIDYSAKGGKSRKMAAENIYVHNDFTSMLSDYKYKYQHKMEDLSVLVTDGKKYYTLSENNLITDVTDDIAAGGAYAQLLSKYCFNIYESPDGRKIGSILMKELEKLKKGQTLDLKVCTMTLFKTNETLNSGHDYFDISETEDYLCKTTLLRDGHIIFPTMSDKKTWVYIDGVKLPGLQYAQTYLNGTTEEGKAKLTVNGDLQEAYDQLIEYAYTELQSVEQTIKQVKDLRKGKKHKLVKNFHDNWVTSKKYSFDHALSELKRLKDANDSEIEEIKDKANSLIKPGDKLTITTANGLAKINLEVTKDNKLVASLSKNVPNGCVFSTFNGVYDKDGNYINFNVVFDKDGNFVSPEDNLKKAKKYFFNLNDSDTRDKNGNIVYGKRSIIKRAVQYQILKELDHAVLLGLISQENGIYTNNGLDNDTLNAIAEMNGADMSMGEITSTETSDAIRTFFEDITLKSIMSINEVERVYSGNPSFFKFQYGLNESGETVLINRSADEFKRFGGLISTGVNNNPEIFGIPSDGMYNCAIVNDVEVSSKQLATIDRMMAEAEYRAAYRNKHKPQRKDSSSYLTGEDVIIYTDDDNVVEGTIRQVISGRIGCQIVVDTAAGKEYKINLDGNFNIENINSKFVDILHDTGIPLKKYVDQKVRKEIYDFEDELSKKSIDEIKTDLQEDKLGYAVLNAKIDAETKAYTKKINVADGAAYISPQMTEWLLRMCGKFDSKIQRAFERLNNPNTDVYTIAEDYKLVTTTVIGAQKYTAYGQRMSDDGKTMIPYYNKMALFPIFRCMATGEFSEIFKKMEENVDENGKPAPVHMLMMDSAVKVGAQGVVDYTADRYNTFKQPFAFLRKQFNTDPHGHGEPLAFGTQMLKVALASLVDGYVYTDQNGNQVRGDVLLEEIMDDMDLLSKIGEEKIRKQFFRENGTLNIEKFSLFLHLNLTSRDADKSILDSISIENRGGVHVMKHPLSATSKVDWLQSIITSRINEEVIDVNTKGSAFYQRSVFGMEGLTVIEDTGTPNALNGGHDLQMIIEDGPAKGGMDCVLSIDYFADILKEAGYENASFEEQRQLLIMNKVIGPDAKCNLIGYRIPTQALSSIHALRCVDVLPVVQHTIILPKEFTKITGSDFDIDKIFINSIGYDVNREQVALHRSVAKEGNELQYVFTEKDDPANRLIRNYITVLTDPNAAHMSHRSIDNDTTLLTDLLKDIESEVNKKEYRVYDFYTLSNQTSTKNEFITGKKGIGPFALNNNSQILTMLYNVSFADTTVMGRLGHASLARATDDYGRSILSWISALINAHVDIAKDSYITRLGVNPMTYNLTNLLIRTGYGDATFYMLSQDVMQKMSLKYTQAQSEFMKDPNRSMYEVRKQCKRDAAVELCGEENVKWAEANLLDNEGYLILDKELGEDGARTIKNLFEKGFLRNVKLNGKNSTYHITMPDGHVQEVSYEQVQALVYVADKVFEAPAEKLANVVKYSKIDTKKQGINITEQLAYVRGVAHAFGDHELLNVAFGDEYDPNSEELKETDLSGSEWFNHGLVDMYEKSFIKKKTHRAVKLFNDVIKNQIIEATPAFLRFVLRVAQNLGRIGDKDISKISSAVSSKLKSEWFIQYAEYHNINIASLVTGNNTIYDRLLDIQSKIQTNDPEFAQFRDSDGQPANTLLKLLISDKNEVSNTDNITYKPEKFADLKFVRLFNALDIDAAKTDEIIQSWEDLLKCGNEEVRTFARDLCVYAFMTSGDQKGATKLFQYVPNEFREDDSSGQSYCDFIRNLLSLLQSQAWCDDHLNSDFIDDICLNNTDDSVFVRTVKPSSTIHNEDGTNERWEVLDIATDQLNTDFVRTKMDLQNEWYTMPMLMSTTDFVDKKNAPLFIKTNRGSSFENGHHRSFIVYKRIGFRSNKKGDKIIPIYAKVNPRGYKIGNYKYYEYGNALIQDDEKEVDVKKLLDVYSGNSKYKKGFDKTQFRSFIDKLLSSRGGTSIERKLGGLFNIQDSITTDDDSVIDPAEYQLHSGGAYGADTEWHRIGESYGVTKQHHYRDAGNDELSKRLRDRGSKAEVLTAELMKEAREKMSQLTGRILQDNTLDNLIARNYYQVVNSDATFAIGQLNGNNVSGGTNAAVQLSILLNHPTHVFDLKTLQWYKYDSDNHKFIVEHTPKLTKNFAGIGTRDIENYSKQDKNNPGLFVANPKYLGDEIRQAATRAIQDVYTRTFGTSKSGSLHLYYRDDRYMPSDPVTLPTAIQLKYQDLLSGKFEGIGVEVYDKWSKDGKTSNKTIVIYLKNNPRKGFFEIVCDKEFTGATYTKPNNEYSIHLKTISAKAKNTSTMANIALSDDEKESLFQALIYAIPEGGKVSTWGELSKGGIAALKSLERRSGGQLIELEETRDGKEKKTGKSIKIPVYIKGTDPNPDSDRKKKDEELRNVLGGGSQADAAIADTLGVVNRGTPLAKALEGVDSVFTKEEQEQIKKAHPNKKLRILSVSRATDPVFFKDRIIEFLKENAKLPFDNPRRVVMMELWSKHDGKAMQEILQACKQYKVACATSFSITTLGGTALEKGVMNYTDLLDRVEALIKTGDLNPTTTTIRIDPILVGRTNVEDIKKVVERGRKLGIKKFVTSLVQSYGYTEGYEDYDPKKIQGSKYNRHVVSGINEALSKVNESYNWEQYYGYITQDDVNKTFQFTTKWEIDHLKELNELQKKYNTNPKAFAKAKFSLMSKAAAKAGIEMCYRDGIGKVHFKPKQEYIDQIGEFLKTLNEGHDDIETCSFSVPGLPSSACLDPLIIERLTGYDVTNPDGTYNRDTSRPDCMCFGCHGDFFATHEKCQSSCAYCYVGHSVDSSFDYYDEHGNLIQSDLTDLNGVEFNYEKVVDEDKELFGPDGLTKEQHEAKENVLKFVDDVLAGRSTGGKWATLINGKAGTGKTYVAGKIIDEIKLRHRGIKIAIGAVGRQAVGVLAGKINGKGITLESVASLMGLGRVIGKRKNEFEMTEKEVEENNKFRKYNVIVIDECSMISDFVIDTIRKFVPKDTAIIFLGDEGLLRPILKDGGSRKSRLFTDKDIQNNPLTKRVRQKGESPILPFSDILHDISIGKSTLDVGKVIKKQKSGFNSNGALLKDASRNMLNRVISAFEEAAQLGDPNHIQITVGLNATKDAYNQLIHDVLYPDSERQFENGEMIVFDRPYVAVESIIGGNVYRSKDGFNNSERGVVCGIEDQIINIGGQEFPCCIYSIKRTDGKVLDVILPRNDQVKTAFGNMLAYQEAAILAGRSRMSWNEFHDLEHTFANMSLGYAVTVDKSLGSTFDITVVDTEDLLNVHGRNNSNMAEYIYTGITRSRYTTILLSGESDVNWNDSSYDTDMESQNISIKLQDDTATDMIPGEEYDSEEAKSYFMKKLPELYKKFKRLCDIAFDSAKKLGIKYIINPNLNDRKQNAVGYSPRYSSVVELAPDMKDNTILHETIHKVTSYWVDAVDNGTAPDFIKEAVAELRSTYEAVCNYYLSLDSEYSSLSESKKKDMRNSILNRLSEEPDMYGLTSFNEFMAELTNPRFSNMIKLIDATPQVKESLLKRILNSVLKILSQTSHELKDKTVRGVAYRNLKTLIETVDDNKYAESVTYWAMINSIVEALNHDDVKTPKVYFTDKYGDIALQRVENGDTSVHNINEKFFGKNTMNTLRAGSVFKVEIRTTNNQSLTVLGVITSKDGTKMTWRIIKLSELYNNYVIIPDSPLQMIDYQMDYSNNIEEPQVDSQDSFLNQLMLDGEDYITKNCL